MLSEALRLVAEGGLGAVTHRSVEGAAGVPHGSVTYHFGSRDDLIAAMVDELVEISERDVADMARDVAMALAPRRNDFDLDRVAETLVGWMDRERDLHLARFELELAAVRDSRLRERMTDAATVFWRMCEPLVVALGSQDPARDGRVMAAMVDGLLLDHLAHDHADSEAVRVGLRQMLRSWAPEVA